MNCDVELWLWTVALFCGGGMRWWTETRNIGDGQLVVNLGVVARNTAAKDSWW
jgi:hypothetical protein